MPRAFCAVALLALACLLPRAARVGLAGDYVDPISRITAQDEALYAHSAITMVTGGDWLTPRFMGRPALYKPPMLIWNAALSAAVLGVQRFALRLPVVILAALALGLIFLWGSEAAGVQAGICAALLVLGNHLFHTLSTLCMTDGLLVAFTVAAVYCLYADPWLESRAALLGFSAASAAAILTKGIAGFFPLAVLAAYWLAARHKERARPARVALAGGLALGFAAPWFLYQLATHGRWFWNEHVLVEIFGYGAGAPPQTSRENPVLFYLVRLAATDPVLLSAAAVAIPAFLAALRRRGPGPTLLACWIGLTVAATLGWQYRNGSYLLALVPPLALLAASYGPFANRRSAGWLLTIVFAGMVVKAASPDSPWGLNYREGTVQPVASALSEYCSEGSSNDLIVVDLADDLYGSALPLRRLRYAMVGDLGARGDYGMPFEDMGIVVTVPEFNDLRHSTGVFRNRLRDWGINSSSPIATLVLARAQGELEELVRAHPTVDFLVPERYRHYVENSGHDLVPAAPGYFFLRSRLRGQRTGLAWTCRM
jgi:hypothetical protein